MAHHTRILEFPHTRSLINARLDDLREEAHGSRRELIFDYHELRLLAPPELIAIDDRPHERLRGEYVPRCLRFRGVRWMKSSGVFTHLDRRGSATPNARLVGRDVVLAQSRTMRNTACCWITLTQAVACCSLRAIVCSEERSGPVEPIEIVRDWSPPPLLPARLIPKPQRLHQRYGGDPITIQLNGRAFQRRLFVGGMEHQSDQRPDVHAVLNLSEDENRWPLTAADRRAQKGEGSAGHGLRRDHRRSAVGDRSLAGRTARAGALLGGLQSLGHHLLRGA